MATILVADDDAMVTALLMDFLEPEGHRVLVARDGAEALALARQASPDLILSDIRMPRMDGLELVRRLRAEPLTRAIGVVLMSSVVPSDPAATGAAAFLAKPFRLDMLGQLVDDLLAAGGDPAR